MIKAKNVKDFKCVLNKDSNTHVKQLFSWCVQIGLGNLFGNLSCSATLLNLLLQMVAVEYNQNSELVWV